MGAKTQGARPGGAVGGHEGTGDRALSFSLTPFLAPRPSSPLPLAGEVRLALVPRARPRRGEAAMPARDAWSSCPGSGEPPPPPFPVSSPPFSASSRRRLVGDRQSLADCPARIATPIATPTVRVHHAHRQSSPHPDLLSVSR